MTADSQAPTLDELLSHAAWVRALARSLVTDSQAADDVVQDTWVAALERPPSHRANVRGWLGTVVRNAVRQRGRQGARRAVREGRVASEREASLPSSAELAARVETQRQLASQVLALDEPYRTVVLLRYFEGLSSAEIARRTATPPGTVRWRLATGLDRLRDQLDEEFGGQRAAWMALLTPLAEPDVAAASAASAAAGSAGLLHGIIAMKLGMKLALGAVLGVAVVSLTPVGGIALEVIAGGGRQSEEPLAVSFRPMESAPSEISGAGMQEVVYEREEVSSTEHAAAPAEPVISLPKTGARVSFIDSDGAAIEGVRAFVWGHEEFEDHSTAEGIAVPRLGGELGRYDLGRGVQYEHPEYVSGDVGTTLVEGQLTDLGTIMLVRSGSVFVRVLDAAGAPVEGAWVEEGSEMDLSLDELREVRLRKTTRSWFSDYTIATRTDAEGQILLKGVKEGRARVWAGARGQLAAHSPPVQVRGGMISEGVTLVLGEPDLQDFILGQVLDAEGQPVPHAGLRYSYRAGGGGGSGSRGTDADGRFVLAFCPEAPRSLRASDPKGHFGPVVMDGVEGGDEVTLRLTNPQYMTVKVTTEGGSLEGLKGRCLATNTRGNFVYRPSEVEKLDDGLRVAMPEEPFKLQIWADHHERVEIGPFDGLLAPQELEVVLPALPGVRGRVTAAGAPVAGAEVALYNTTENQRLFNGFPVRVEGGTGWTATTIEDGTYQLDLRASDEFYVRASAEGYAAAEIGPMRIDYVRGLQGLDLELTEGGLIEGVVWGAERVAGHIVAISRGDTHSRTIRTDLEGAFRFENLTPGPWQVELATEEISPRSSHTQSSGEAFDESNIKSNCVVVEGQTTRHDLALAGSNEIVLLGRLELDGVAAFGWRAMLTPPGGNGMIRGSGRLATNVAEDGTFRLVAPEEGEYKLVLNPPHSSFFSLVDNVTLYGGDTSWLAAYATGSVRFSNATSEVGMAMPLDFLVGEDGDRSLVIGIVGDDEGVSEIVGVPLMAATLKRFTVDEYIESRDPTQGGTVLRSVSLVAGQTVEVTLP